MEEALVEAAAEEVVAEVAEISVVVAGVDGTAGGAEVARSDVEVAVEVAFHRVVAEEDSAEEGGAVNKLSITKAWNINSNVRARHKYPSVEHRSIDSSVIRWLRV